MNFRFKYCLNKKMEFKMFKKKIIITSLITAICFGVVSPVMAGYNTIYIPTHTNYQNITGQTVVYTPSQTVVIQENVLPQTIVVQKTQEPIYIQKTTGSNDALWVAGIGSFVGGVLLSNILHQKHKPKHQVKPKPQPNRGHHAQNKHHKGKH